MWRGDLISISSHFWALIFALSRIHCDMHCHIPSSTSIYGSFLRNGTRLFQPAVYISEGFCPMKAFDMGPVTGASQSFIAIPLPLYDLIAQSIDGVGFHPWFFRPTQYEQRRVLGIFICAMSKPLILT
jgi:hypothetical protein